MAKSLGISWRKDWLWPGNKRVEVKDVHTCTQVGNETQVWIVRWSPGRGTWQAGTGRGGRRGHTGASEMNEAEETKINRKWVKLKTWFNQRSWTSEDNNIINIYNNKNAMFFYFPDPWPSDKHSRCTSVTSHVFKRATIFNLINFTPDHLSQETSYIDSP